MPWARRITWVSAVNVTDRYTPKSKPPANDKVRLLVKVLDQPGGKRVPAKVFVTQATDAKAQFQGQSKDESVDLNDILGFETARNEAYEIRVENGARNVRREVRTGTNAQEVVVLCLNDTPAPVYCVKPAN